MKTSFLIKLGSSAMLLGLTAVGCTATNPHVARASDGVTGPKQSAHAQRDADAAVKARQPDRAVALGEQAVALSPRDAHARAILGQAYLLAGRFASAETTFGEALTLDPNQPKTRFSLALAQVALGKGEAARATLAALQGAGLPETDIGLATTLSGDHKGGMTILEHAARADGASAKARQNLAFAYALAGRWNEAKTIAEQDVPADQLPYRLTEWSQLSRPKSSWEQVSALLGVTASVDMGRPTALALTDPSPAAAPVALAAAEPAPVASAAPATAPVAPVETAAAAAPAPAFVAPAPASQAAPLVLAAAERKHLAARSLPAARPVADGKWVIQLGAYSQPRAIDAAWSRLSARVATGGFAPARSTFVRDGSATLYRLTIAGFGTRDDAQRMCGQIRGKGGQCFVRPAAGEQPILMASNASAKIAMR